MAKIMLATGLIVAYGYFIEAFMAWYSGNRVRASTCTLNRIARALRACLLAADRLQRRRSRSCCGSRGSRATSGACSWSSLVVNVGMWLERFVIVVTSLHRDFLPSSWGMYYPTVWDWATFLGSIGLFLCLLFLFLRFLPMISIFEMRTLLPKAASQGGGRWQLILRSTD